MKRVGLGTLAMLVACGGGGGGSDWLTFEPSSLDVTFFQSDPTTVTVIATSSRQLSGPIYVGVVDASGVLRGAAEFEQDGMQVETRLHLDPMLSEGVHTGSLQVRVCADDPVTCARPLGAVSKLPYRITVLQGIDLRELTPLAGAGPWRTLGGDGGHTGFVPATLDPARFSRRWSAAGWGSGIAAEGGRVFVVTDPYPDAWSVTAFSERDGGVDWSFQGVTNWGVSPPAVGHGRVYVATSGKLWAFDQASGEAAAQLPMSSNTNRIGPPEVFGDHVYSMSGDSDALSRFDGVALATSWSSTAPAWYDDAYTVLADDGYVYLHAGDQLDNRSDHLQVLDAADGHEVFRIPDLASDDPCMYGCWSEGEGPVRGGDGIVFNTLVRDYDSTSQLWRGRLQRFDVGNRVASWDKQGNYNSLPAVAGDTLCVVNGHNLDALDAASGALRWSWPIPGAVTYFRQQVLVVGTHAFVTSPDAVHAIELATREQVWSYPATGKLAISENGILYILTTRGLLVAVNLH